MSTQQPGTLRVGQGFRMRAIFACLLALLLGIVFTFAHTQAAEAKEITYKDVTPKTKYSADIKWMTKNGIFTGDKKAGKYYFKPNQELTRKEVAVAISKLGKLYGLDDEFCTENIVMADVNSKSPGYKEIKWLVNTGLFKFTKEDKVKGTKTYKFNPNQPIKRHELAGIFCRLNDLANDGSINNTYRSAVDNSLFMHDVFTETPNANECVWVTKNKVMQRWGAGKKTEVKKEKDPKTNKEVKKKVTYNLYDLHPYDTVKRGEFANYVRTFDKVVTKWYAFATMKVKNYGTVKLTLDKQNAPKTVANFVKLANSGFYNGTTYHRIIKDFMAQGGSAKEGTKADSINGEFQANQEFMKKNKGHWENYLPFKRGAIAMARGSGGLKIDDNGSIIWDDGYNSASSEFFIMHKTPTLDHNGEDAVKKLKELKAAEKATQKKLDKILKGNPTAAEREVIAKYANEQTAAQTELDTLLKKAKPTDEELKQISTLQSTVKSLEKKLDSKLTKLVSKHIKKKSPTANEKSNAKALIKEDAVNKKAVADKKTDVANMKAGFDNSYFGYYCGFGNVIKGIEVIDKICEKASPTDKNGSIAKEAQPVITSIKAWS